MASKAKRSLGGLTWLAGYTVTIIFEVIPHEDGKPSTNHFSGFVIRFRGKRWLVTVAHGARDLPKVLEAGRLIRINIADAFEFAKNKGMPYPLPNESSKEWIILSDDNSYDVALLPISDLIWSNLKKGKVRCVSQNEWMGKPEKFDFFAIVGTPAETLEHDGKVVGNTKIYLPTSYSPKRAFAKLQSVNRPEGADVVEQPRFYGRIVRSKDGVTLKKIEGVSGGTLLGCKWKRNGKGFTVRVIGVQSGVVGKKTVSADYLRFLPKFFDAYVARKSD